MLTRGELLGVFQALEEGDVRYVAVGWLATTLRGAAATGRPAHSCDASIVQPEELDTLAAKRPLLA